MAHQGAREWMEPELEDGVNSCLLPRSTSRLSQSGAHSLVRLVRQVVTASVSTGFELSILCLKFKCQATGSLARSLSTDLSKSIDAGRLHHSCSLRGRTSGKRISTRRRNRLSRSTRNSDSPRQLFSPPPRASALGSPKKSHGTIGVSHSVGPRPAA